MYLQNIGRLGKFCTMKRVICWCHKRKKMNLFCSTGDSRVLAEYIFIVASLWLCVHTVSVCIGVAPPKHKLLDPLSNVQVLPPPLPPHLLPSRGWGKNASCREAASVALNSLLYRWKRIVYDISLNTEEILQPLGTRRMEPDSPKGAGREGEVQSHPFRYNCLSPSFFRRLKRQEKNDTL